jgi:hypothetical protein
MCHGNHENAVRIHAEEHVEREAADRTFPDIVPQDRKNERSALDALLCSLDGAEETPTQAFPASLIQPRRFEDLVIRSRMVDGLRHFRAVKPA